MSRRRHLLPAAFLLALAGVPEGSRAQSAPVEDGGDPPSGDCSQAEKDVAAISGEILVCGSRADDQKHRLGTREEAQKRYAEETKFKGDPQAPDVAGAGIFRGKPTFGGMCIPGMQKCPPPPAIVVDFAALPPAPPGSDADRISKGLPPIGNDTGMIVPPATADTVPAEAVSPSGSASPEAAPSG